MNMEIDTKEVIYHDNKPQLFKLNVVHSIYSGQSGQLIYLSP